MVTLPLALVLLAGAFWMASQRPAIDSNVPNLLDEPRHPVTAPMWDEAEDLAGLKAPSFELNDSKGRPVRFGGVPPEKPMVLVFTKDGCPCSIESQPFFNQIAKGYGDRARFLGVIDAPAATAADYSSDFSVPYPMLSANDETVFRAFKSERSVYVTLIDPTGIVVRQWPGYSKAMLKELNTEIASLAGGAPADVDLTAAPEEMTSGCRLFRPVGE
jgi:peroxiredoxin